MMLGDSHLFLNWWANFQIWMTQIFGPSGPLRGPIIAFVGITILGYVIYYAVSSGGILFGAWPARARRTNRVEFAGVGTVWGTDRELEELLRQGNFKSLGGKSTSTAYVSTDDEGNELGHIRVTRWSGD